MVVFLLSTSPRLVGAEGKLDTTIDLQSPSEDEKNQGI